MELDWNLVFPGPCSRQRQSTPRPTRRSQAPQLRLRRVPASSQFRQEEALGVKSQLGALSRDRPHPLPLCGINPRLSLTSGEKQEAVRMWALV